MARVTPAPPDGLAISIVFDMLEKNSFTYVHFLPENGVATISGQEFLEWFDQERSVSIMDYVDPRRNFTGRITATVLSTSRQRCRFGFRHYRYLEKRACRRLRSFTGRLDATANCDGGTGSGYRVAWQTHRTPEIMATLESRALQRASVRGLTPGTAEFGEWWRLNGPNARGIPPSVVEAELAHPGTTGVRVIVNQNGAIVTVIPGH